MRRQKLCRYFFLALIFAGSLSAFAQASRHTGDKVPISQVTPAPPILGCDLNQRRHCASRIKVHTSHHLAQQAALKTRGARPWVLSTARVRTDCHKALFGRLTTSTRTRHSHRSRHPYIGTDISGMWYYYSRGCQPLQALSCRAQ